jgi:hypothetical protein
MFEKLKLLISGKKRVSPLTILAEGAKKFKDSILKNYRLLICFLVGAFSGFFIVELGYLVSLLFFFLLGATEGAAVFATLVYFGLIFSLMYIWFSKVPEVVEVIYNIFPDLSETSSQKVKL